MAAAAATGPAAMEDDGELAAREEPTPGVGCWPYICAPCGISGLRPAAASASRACSHCHGLPAWEGGAADRPGTCAAEAAAAQRQLYSAEEAAGLMAGDRVLMQWDDPGDEGHLQWYGCTLVMLPEGEAGGDGHWKLDFQPEFDSTVPWNVVKLAGRGQLAVLPQDEAAAAGGDSCGAPSDDAIVHCTTCELSWHATCIDRSGAAKAQAGEGGQWQCPDCERCALEQQPTGLRALTESVPFDYTPMQQPREPGQRTAEKLIKPVTDVSKWKMNNREARAPDRKKLAPNYAQLKCGVPNCKLGCAAIASNLPQMQAVYEGHQSALNDSVTHGETYLAKYRGLKMTLNPASMREIFKKHKHTQAGDQTCSYCATFPAASQPRPVKHQLTQSSSCYTGAISKGAELHSQQKKRQLRYQLPLAGGVLVEVHAQF